MADENDDAEAEAAPETASERPDVDKYIANFDGDEIDGKFYKLGDTIDKGVDQGTLDYLVSIGRITPKSAEDSDEPSLGGETSEVPPPPEPEVEPDATEPDPPLDADETAARDALVDGNSKADLLKLAAEESVDATEDNNKTEIATKIVLGRRA